MTNNYIYGIVFAILWSLSAVAQVVKTVDLPAGVDQVEVTINPVVDTLTEGLETVSMLAVNNLAYQIGPKKRGIVTISDAVLPPDITGFFPDKGEVGSTVIIRGHNFTTATAVSFNGTAAEFKIDYAEQITAIVPSSASDGPISILTEAGAISSVKSYAVLRQGNAWDQNWFARDTGPSGFRLNAITFGDGLFVAVGEAGNILTSPDAVNWTLVKSFVNEQLFGVASGVINGTNYFVAVGGNGVILRSSDGLNWTFARAKDWSRDLFCVAYGGGAFVIGGVNKVTKTSDLKNWKDAEVSRQDEWRESMTAITYGSGKFVATTALHSHDGRGHRRIIQSNDGEKWDTVLGRSGEWWYRYSCVAYSSEFGFLISGHHANDPAGNQDYDGYSQSNFWHEGAFDANHGSWVHVAKPDATGWTERLTKPYDRNMFGATFADGVFVTVGNSGTAQLTTDATVWQEVNTGTNRRLRGIAFGNGRFVAVGNDGVIVQSPDAVSWSVSRNPVSALPAFAKPTIRSMAEGLGSFVAVGDSGTVLISTNAKTWVQASGAGTVEFVPGSFTWAQAKSDAVIKGGKLAATWTLGGVSTNVGWLAGTDQGSEGTWRWDGTTVELTQIPWLTGQPNGAASENYMFWNGKNLEDKPATLTTGYFLQRPDNNLDGQNIFGIAFGFGSFVAVGENRIYVSKDLKSWKRPAGTDKPFRAVEFLNGQFIAVGGGGCIYTSTNALDWAQQTSGTGAELRAVAFGNGKYVIAGFGGTILTSTDSINWKISTTGNGNNLYGAAFGSGTFLVVGDGIAWTSTNGDLWRLRGNSGRAFRTLEYGNNQFIATAENSPKGSLLRSFDGTSWLEVPLGQSLAIDYYGLYFSDSTIFAMGQYSTILQSLPYIGYTVVSIEKIEDASELGPKAGRFILKRTGDLTQPLKVQVEVGGTATEIDDYTFQGPILP
jgi:hypothetical protein